MTSGAPIIPSPIADTEKPTSIATSSHDTPSASIPHSARRIGATDDEANDGDIAHRMPIEMSASCSQRSRGSAVEAASAVVAPPGAGAVVVVVATLTDRPAGT